MNEQQHEVLQTWTRTECVGSQVFIGSPKYGTRLLDVKGVYL